MLNMCTHMFPGPLCHEKHNKGFINSYLLFHIIPPSPVSCLSASSTRIKAKNKLKKFLKKINAALAEKSWHLNKDSNYGDATGCYSLLSLKKQPAVPTKVQLYNPLMHVTDNLTTTSHMVVLIRIVVLSFTRLHKSTVWTVSWSSTNITFNKPLEIE